VCFVGRKWSKGRVGPCYIDSMSLSQRSLPLEFRLAYLVSLSEFYLPTSKK